MKKNQQENKIVGCLVRDRFSAGKLMSRLSANGYSINQIEMTAKRGAVTMAIFVDSNFADLEKKMCAFLFDEFLTYQDASWQSSAIVSRRMKNFSGLIKIYKET